MQHRLHFGSLIRFLEGETIHKLSLARRIVLIVCLAFIDLALLVDWYGAGAVAWSKVGNAVGMSLVLASLIFNLSPGRLRLCLNVAAFGVLIPSAYFILMHRYGT